MEIEKSKLEFFSNLIEIFLQVNPISNNSLIENDVNYITNTITRAANIAIRKTTKSTKRNLVPWWNEEIKETIKKKNKALKKFQRTGTIEDLINLKHLRAKTRFLVKRNKAKSWISFTSSLGPNVDSSLVCNKVNSLRGQKKQTRYTLCQTIICLQTP